MVLGSLSRAQQSIFLSLLYPGVSRQQTGSFEGLLQLSVELHQCPRDTQTDGLGLTISPSPVDSDKEVELFFCLGQHERLLDGILQAVQREILDERTNPLIHMQGDVTLAWTKKNSGYGRLSLSGSVILN